jgi:hypothetical protein
VTSSQSYKNFTSEIYENSAVFLQVFKIQSYKAFFTSEFFWWILQVNFSLKIHWKKFESYKNICLLVKFTVKKINPIKPRILLGKNLLVNFKIDFHKMKYYNQSFNYIAVLISFKGFHFRNR